MVSVLDINLERKVLVVNIGLFKELSAVESVIFLYDGKAYFVLVVNQDYLLDQDYLQEKFLELAMMMIKYNNCKILK